MKRRNFIKSVGSIGVASATMGTAFASASSGDKKSLKRSNIPVYDGWAVIVVGGGPAGCAAAVAAAVSSDD